MKKNVLIAIQIVILNSFILLFTSAGYAQFSLHEIQKIDHLKPCGNVIFSPDSKSILVSGMNQKGLTLIDLSTLESKKLNEDEGAGNEVYFSDDGTQIIYKTWYLNDKGMRFSNVVSQLIDTGEKKVLAKAKRDLGALRIIKDHAVFQQKMQVQAVDLNSKKSTTAPLSETEAYTDNNLNLVLLKDGQTTILNPGNAARYIWVSISPDKTKVLYRVPGKGTFIADLQGNVIARFGNIKAAKWTTDGNWIIGMKDSDNGFSYTSSDIVMCSADGQKSVNLTDKSEMIALYPAISPDNSMVAFTTDHGELYLARLY